MSILEIEVGDLRATSVAFTPTELVVALAYGRRIATPLEWYPRLAKASGAQRENYEISPLGIHWPDIDERCRHAEGSTSKMTAVATRAARCGYSGGRRGKRRCIALRCRTGSIAG